MLFPECGATSWMRCLPMAPPPVCVASYAETTIVLVPPFSAGVMSYENAS